ncbi:hypothetical protein HZB69_01200 [Candidatus Amesbacteria bacterium]|nr:hypothetical protein [Candidatus Amesbacteria bacterium]
MTRTKLLVGSLSNDLFRVATLRQRGANKAASRFLVEAKRWAEPLLTQLDKVYLKSIANKVLNSDPVNITLVDAEYYLMYGVLLQNHALHSD